MRTSWRLLPLALLLAGCGGGTPAAGLAKAPALPGPEVRCALAKSSMRPVIIEWPSADRGMLESRARDGLVVVRFDGCEMEVLPNCSVESTYKYEPFTPAREHKAITDADSLYASLPLGAVRLEGELKRVGELDVDTMLVGRWQARDSGFKKADLEGFCTGATHVVTAMSVGAFRLTTAAGADVAGDGRVAVAGARGTSRERRATLSEDGNAEACASATTRDGVPPAGCAAPIRLELSVLDGKAPVCPKGEKWNGSRCGGGGGSNDALPALVLLGAGLFLL